MPDHAPGPAPAPAPDDTLVYFGDEVKALGGGRFAGYLVRFGTPDRADFVGDFFTKESDLGLDDDGTGTTDVLYQHGMDPVFGKKRIGRGTLKLDDVGVWLDAQLDLRKSYTAEVAEKYGAAIDALIAAKSLGLSSGVPGHLVERVPVGGANWLKTWRLGLDASLTPTPCEPRTLAVPLKGLFPAPTKDAGLGYDDTYRDGAAASAAVATLSAMLQDCIACIFAGMGVPGPADPDTPPTRAEKLARIAAEFADFTQDSLAVIAALMDDDDAAKSLARFTSAAPAPGAVLTDPRGVASAVGGYRDLVAKFAAVRERDGRHLGAVKLADLRAFLDGASPAIDDLRAILARHSAPAPGPGRPALAAKARLKLLALKHKHLTPASRQPSPAGPPAEPIPHAHPDRTE